MRLLLDTHAFIWWDEGVISPRGRGLIVDAEEIYISAASAWEIAIKTAIGKMQASAPLATAIADYGFTPLPIAVAHADAVRELPPYHSDPFDRLLIAQATSEGLTILTADSKFEPYRVLIEWL